jgi:hypothetical protein
VPIFKLANGDGELMCAEFQAGCGLTEIVRDPLVRLVMASDGVSEHELISVMQRAQRAVWAGKMNLPRERINRNPSRGQSQAGVRLSA